MIRINSRNVDGLRVQHAFDTTEDLLQDWNSDDPKMGDNEILLVLQNREVLYSFLGSSQEVRTSDLVAWLAPYAEDAPDCPTH